jgi:hypothetical protein
MDKYFARIIDENGLFVCDDFVDELTEFTIETPCPDGFYLPKWNGTQWVEGKTAEEIAAIQAAVTTEKTDGERISDLETIVLELGGII